MKSRFTGVAICAGAAMIAAWIFAGTAPQAPGVELAARRARLYAAGADMNSVFVLQRLYGNPTVDIGAREWQALRTVEAREQLALAKGEASASNVWTEQGPWNIAGRVRGLAIDPTDQNVLYAVAASGGVWKSTTGGQNWSPIGDDLAILSFGAVAIDPNNHNRIIVGTGEPDPTSIGRTNATPIYSRGVGAFRSEDDGQTWQLLAWPGASNVAVHRIAISPVSADTFLVATTTDLWKTTDAGSSWTRVLNGLITDVKYKPGDPSVVYAIIGDNNGSSSNGVYVSEAGGQRFTFHKLGTNFPRADSTGRMVMDIPKADPNRIYVAVTYNRSLLQSTSVNDFFGLMMSRDGGTTWERKPNAISSSFTNGQAYYDLAIAVSPADPSVVFLGGIDIWRSVNNGDLFSRMTNGYVPLGNPQFVHVDQHALVFHPSNSNVVYATNDGGVFTTANLGFNWDTRYTNLGTIQYYGISYDPSNTANIFGGTQDNGTLGKVTPQADQWLEVSGGDGGNVAIDPGNSNIRYVVTTPSSGGRSILRVTTGVATQLSSGLQPGVDRFNWIAPLFIPTGDRSRLYTATQFLYLMHNPYINGSQWQVVSPALTAYSSYSSIVTDVAIAPTNGDWAYTVSGDGRASLTQNLSAIDPSWSDVSEGLPTRWLAGVAVDWNDPNTAYIAASGFGTGHAFMTTNAGQSWTDISGDLPDIPAAKLIPSRSNNNTLFLATDLGVWYTTNRGTNWTRFGTGLPNVVAYDMEMTPDNVLVVGTHGRGAWTASTILSTDRPGTVPASIVLDQNWPNPFATQTQIAFVTGKRVGVTIRLYDTDGRTVRTLFDGTVDPGRHDADLEAGTLRPGTYFVELVSGAERHVRKIMLVK